MQRLQMKLLTFLYATPSKRKHLTFLNAMHERQQLTILYALRKAFKT